MFDINHGVWHDYRAKHDLCAELAWFTAHGSADQATRVMGVTAMLLTFLQTAGTGMIAHPPGFLLVRADGKGREEDDPIYQVMMKLRGLNVGDERAGEEDFERNHKTMQCALNKHHEILHKAGTRYLTESSGTLAEMREQNISRFRKLQDETFGGGRGGCYADRRDIHFGFITDDTGHAVLRLEREKDWAALREDVVEKRWHLMEPRGYGRHLLPQRKALSLVGFVTQGEWDDEMFPTMIENALPVFFLPHDASHQLRLPNNEGLEWIGTGLSLGAREVNGPPMAAMERLFIKAIGNTTGSRMERIRRRLLHFPMDYEFYVMRTIREIYPCCQRLVDIVSGGQPNLSDLAAKKRKEESDMLFMDLMNCFLQGMALSVEALGWHGFGFGLPCSHEDVMRVLRLVRSSGGLSKREVLRKIQSLDAERRDAILAVLEAEGLLCIEKRHISAVPFREYWQTVRQRFGMQRTSTSAGRVEKTGKVEEMKYATHAGEALDRAVSA